MKEKTIPLYFWGYTKRYYITHPWKWFKDLHIGIKNAWHRMRCGWCWCDLWNLDDYIGHLLPNMLEELATRSHGWPESEEHPTFEDWQLELRIMAKLLNILNIDVIMEDEKFESAFSDYRAGLTIHPLHNLPFYGEYVVTPEEGAKIDAAETKWQRLQIETDILRMKLGIRICKLFPSLWD